MKQYRVTKYNPIFRGSDGAYLRSEWTSVSDIGKLFAGEVLTKEQYISVEDKYVESSFLFMDYCNIKHLTINDLEVRSDYYSRLFPDDVLIDQGIKDGDLLDNELIGKIIRLSLREKIWCKLLCRSKFFIHFGYDYYMYIGVGEEDFVLPSLPDNIYAELFYSPYNKDSDDC